MNYKLTSTKNNFLEITFSTKVTRETTEIQLPAWRPGRYELGNFAKNIQKFEVKDSNGNNLNFNKITKDKWVIDTQNVSEIIVIYNYYAMDFNAGSTFIGEDVLYVNPVNCFIYIPERQNEPCSVEIPINNGQQIACGGNFTNGILTTKSFHELVDTPFLVSSQLQSKTYQVNQTDFTIWFYGECKPNWEKIIPDFTKFTKLQLEKFGDFPVKNYHFINIIHPFKAYHGVEHTTSTVIVLGPSYKLMKEYYVELLGVSSHELYHTWNIKTIRPVEMLPYDYSKENYSKLGYVAEGVTTYMGDLFLYESGVFDQKQYIVEFNKYLDKHYSNDGRLNLSVADSSFDTWLDGYEMGIPNRKSSIYTEGCLVSFMIDSKIKEATNNTKSLHDVMQKLYVDFGKKQIGYTEQNYKEIIEEISGISFANFFNNYIWGANDFTSELKSCLNYVGYDLIKQKSKIYSETYGLKLITLNNKTKVIHVMQNSSANSAGLIREDEIISINNFPIKNDLENWLEYFKNDKITLGIIRNGIIKNIELSEVNSKQFFKYYIQKR